MDRHHPRDHAVLALDRLRLLVEPILADVDAVLYDVERAGPVVRVTIDRPGGIDLDAIASVSRELARLLDDDDLFDGAYQLEVSSPGIERVLRTPEHWAAAVGSSVSVKLVRGGSETRRVEGVVVAADDTAATIDVDGAEVAVEYRSVDRARIRFQWGTGKPGAGRRGPSTRQQFVPAASTAGTTKQEETP